MNKVVKVFLALGCMALADYLFVVAFTTKLDPYWLNTVLMLFSVALGGGAAVYLLIKLIKRITN